MGITVGTRVESGIGIVLLGIDGEVGADRGAAEVIFRAIDRLIDGSVVRIVVDGVTARRGFQGMTLSLWLTLLSDRWRLRVLGGDIVIAGGSTADDALLASAQLDDVRRFPSVAAAVAALGTLAPRPPSAERLRAEGCPRRNGYVVVLSGALEREAIAVLNAALQRAVSLTGGVTPIILDCTMLASLDETGIELLTEAHNSLRPRLFTAALQPPLKREVDARGLGPLFATAPDVESVLKAFDAIDG